MATKARSASVCCVQPRSARAARIWREETIVVYVKYQMDGRYRFGYNNQI